MVFIANTPESQAARLTRKDSLNFDTTCHGINPASGLPCRRGFAPNAAGQPSRGIVTRVDGKELFFCMQHKDQAKDLVLKRTKSFQKRRQEMGRSSIDTLVEKVEVVVSKVNTPGGPVRIEARSTTKTDSMPGVGSVGITTVTTTPLYSNSSYSGRLQKPQEPRMQAPKLIRFLCCSFSFDRPSKHARPMEKIDEEKVVARPAKSGGGRNSQVQFSDTPLPPPLPLMSVNDGKQRRPSAFSGHSKKTNALQPKTNAANNNTHNKKRWSPQDLIPSHLPEETALRLWETLSKPFSDDDEPGYIYVFLLTDKPLTPAPTAAAAASTSNFLKAAAAHSPATAPRKLLLKIGRAVNVQRRLHQWTQQCSYSLSLMRYYPYAPLPQVPRQVPNSHRIERLIHLELREQNKVIECDKCGKTHLEWFEVDASREGLKHVDSVIRKWIQFGEEMEGKSPEEFLKGVTRPVKSGNAGSANATPQKTSGSGPNYLQAGNSTPTKQGKKPQSASPQRNTAKQGASGQNTPKQNTPQRPAAQKQSSSNQNTPKQNGSTPKKTSNASSKASSSSDGSPAGGRRKTQDTDAIQRMKKARDQRIDDWESGDDEVVAMGKETIQRRKKGRATGRG